MPFIKGRNGSVALGRDISFTALRDIARAMRAKAKDIARQAERYAGRYDEFNQGPMLRSDARKMATNAEYVEIGEVNKAASRYASEDTAARDEYPFAFHRLLRSLGYLTWLRGYPGDNRR